MDSSLAIIIQDVRMKPDTEAYWCKWVMLRHYIKCFKLALLPLFHS